MKMTRIAVAVFIATGISLSATGQGMLGRLKQKAVQAGERAIERKIDQKVNAAIGNPGASTGPGGAPHPSNAPANKGGGGLVVTPPDVKQNITEAESNYKTGKYSEARYAIKQAMLGVEMEIGEKVLKSLPASVAGLNKRDEDDRVTSMGAGWVGLAIQRVYADNADKYLQINIANNSAWVTAANSYLANTNYASSGGEQNWKQIKVKEYRGIIEYNESTGYKVSVPVGQSSIIVWDGVNFASEQDMMNAVNAFDIDGIKKTLGEK